MLAPFAIGLLFERRWYRSFGLSIVGMMGLLLSATAIAWTISPSRQNASAEAISPSSTPAQQLEEAVMEQPTRPLGEAQSASADARSVDDVSTSPPATHT